MKHILLIFVSFSILAVDQKSSLPVSFGKDHLKSAAKEITLTNKISNKMLIKRYWGQNFTPESFGISIKGKPLVAGSSMSVPLEEDRVTVRYSYSFAKGAYSGFSDIVFKIKDAGKKDFDLTFSWEDDDRLNMTGMIIEKKIEPDRKKRS